MAEEQGKAMEMEEPSTPGKETESGGEGGAAKSTAECLVLSVVSSLELVERAVCSKEGRFFSRAMRQTAAARKKMSPPTMLAVLSALPPSELKQLCLDRVANAPKPSHAAPMEVEGEGEGETPPDVSALSVGVVECEVYLVLLAVQYLLDAKELDGAFEVSSSLLAYCEQQQRRSLDALQATVWFYHSLICERMDTLPSIRPRLLAAHRTSVLNRDEQGQAMYLNLLLRNFLTPSKAAGGELSLVEQADKLRSQTTFPDSASNNQFSRYFYYIGRIKTIQLEYTEALNYLQEALRKAPQTGVVGFRITVNKAIAIVQLLKGEIPPRSMFTQKPAQLRDALQPYMELTQAVRNGDLSRFKAAAEEHQATFLADGQLSLINRLRHNVIKAGLRKINVAYARISIADICEKLKLEDKQDAEYIVAKAIRDGVIDATLDHGAQELRSNENQDIYATTEPQELYHKRIQFCLNIHNEAVQAMSYPDDSVSGKDGTESAEDRLEKLKEEAELAKSIAEEEEEF